MTGGWGKGVSQKLLAKSILFPVSLDERGKRGERRRIIMFIKAEGYKVTGEERKVKM